MKIIFKTCIFLHLFSSLYGADVCVELTAKFATHHPDGVSKEIITLNDKFPGPTIRANIGDTIHVRFVNRLRNSQGKTYPTSVHFHGIEQIHSNWMDGPEQVTQCPIAYNKDMVYSTQLHQSGTYWYHSHHAWQYVDGFWGFLIVDNKPNEVYKYDDEILISLMDWHWSSGEHLSELLKLPLTSPTLGAGQPPVPNSTLINGRGNANCKSVHGVDKRLKCHQATTQQMTVFKVMTGLTYRVRVLNPSSRAAYNFSIDGHKLRVIELDGVDVKDHTHVDVVTIWAAQRCSFLVTMNKPGRNAWIRAEMVVNLGDPNVIRNIKPLAAIQYMGPTPVGFTPGHAATGGGAQGRPAIPDMSLGMENQMRPPSAVSTGDYGACSRLGFTKITDNLDENQMTVGVNDVPVTSTPTPRPILWDQRNSVAVSPPGTDIKAPTTVDKEVVLTVNLGYNNVTSLFESSVNGVIYNVEGNKVPAIFRVVKNKPVPNHFVPIDIPLKKNIQIVINNLNDAEHPWHLHGHTFWVMGTGAEGAGAFNATRDAGKLNTVRLRRDTTHVHPQSWTVVRFHTDNPGVWILHCHINWHLERGMGAVFVEGKEKFHYVPKEALRVCKDAGVSIH